MTGFESSMVTSIDGLRTLYAQPVERIAKKQLDHVNEAGRAFIAASPFLVLATASQQGSRLLAQRRPAGFCRSCRRRSDAVETLKFLQTVLEETWESLRLEKERERVRRWSPRTFFRSPPQESETPFA